MTLAAAAVRLQPMRATWRRIGGAALALLLAANAGIIVALWLGGLRDGDGAGGLLPDIARICGLLGAYLVLLELQLLARLPLLDRLLGFGRLTTWHRRNGIACVALLLGHAVLITVGYALADDVSLPAELRRLLSGYPGVITAVAGLGCLVAVVVSSVVIVRRRLRYETWYFVHLYAYLGVALAFGHQLATGTAFVGEPLARAYWTALYAVTLAAIVTCRLALPAVSSARHRLRVARVIEEAPAWCRSRSRGSRSTGSARAPASSSAGSS